MQTNWVKENKLSERKQNDDTSSTWVMIGSFALYSSLILWRAKRKGYRHVRRKIYKECRKKQNKTKYLVQYIVREVPFLAFNKLCKPVCHFIENAFFFRCSNRPSLDPRHAKNRVFNRIDSLDEFVDVLEFKLGKKAHVIKRESACLQLPSTTISQLVPVCSCWPKESFTVVPGYSQQKWAIKPGYCQ